jgi:hypothetical protein
VKDSGFSEGDALNHVKFRRIDAVEFETILRRIKILDFSGSVTAENKAYWSLNQDIAIWLSKVVASSGNRYLTDLLFYSKCVDLSPPALLDLKMSEEKERRYFPAERLMETWIAQAKKKPLASYLIFNTVNAAKSFYSHNRVPLLEVEYVYKPKPKPPLTEELLRNFREGFNFYGRVLFDFFVSVPLRDGQFTRCKYCGREFFPRWRNIESYPKIEPFSAFIILPEKGHESEKYREDLMQVCFLTKTVATELNALRDLKEKLLGRSLGPDEYIFTHQINQAGITHVTPITQPTIGTIFRTNKAKTKLYLYPHLIRTWTYTTLGNCGLDELIRNVYLGHQITHTASYTTQMIPQWRQIFREKKALEALEVVSAPKQTEVEAPKPEMDLSNEEFELLRSLFRRFKASGGVL